MVNGYNYHDGQDMSRIHDVQTYAKEAVSHIERIYGCLPKYSTSMSVTDYYPELDDIPFLLLDDCCKF